MTALGILDRAFAFAEYNVQSGSLRSIYFASSGPLKFYKGLGSACGFTLQGLTSCSYRTWVWDWDW